MKIKLKKKSAALPLPSPLGGEGSLGFRVTDPMELKSDLVWISISPPTSRHHSSLQTKNLWNPHYSPPHGIIITRLRGFLMRHTRRDLPKNLPEMLVIFFKIQDLATC